MFIKELILRFGMKSTKFHKKFIWIGGVFSAIGLGLREVSIDWVFIEANNPKSSDITLSSILIVGGIVAAAVAATTVSDTAKLEEKKIKQIS